MNGKQTADNVYSLHATAYPWVHQQWFKTFDHQAYVYLDITQQLDFLNSHESTGSAAVSKFTKKFAHPATR